MKKLAEEEAERKRMRDEAEAAEDARILAGELPV